MFIKVVASPYPHELFEVGSELCYGASVHCEPGFDWTWEQVLAKRGIEVEVAHMVGEFGRHTDSQMCSSDGGDPLYFKYAVWRSVGNTKYAVVTQGDVFVMSDSGTTIDRVG